MANSKWQRAPFESVLEKVNYPSKIQRNKFLHAGDFPVVSQEAGLINGYWNNPKDVIRVERPLIVFGDHTQVRKYVDFDFVLGADGVKLLKPQAKIEPKFFYYWLLSVELKTLGYARHFRLLKDLEVPFPESVSEQRRIVKILDEAFEHIAKAKANIEKNLQNARELFEAELETVFRTTSGWVAKPISEIGITQTGSTPRTSERKYYGDYIPFVKPADFRKDGSICYDNDGLSKAGLQVARRIEGGSVLMVCIGATIGKTGYTERPITMNQQINSVTPGPEVHAKLLYYQMLTSPFQNLVKSNAGQATLPIISKSKWSALLLKYPSHRRKQDTIVARLDSLSADTMQVGAVCEKKLLGLEALKKSVLRQAFNGDL